MGFVATKLRKRRVLSRIARERLAEPLHLNVAALGVWLFGSYRAKIAFDLVIRQNHAYSLLEAADQARRLGIDAITAVELGVASGAGLLNMCAIASRVSEVTGVRIDVAGFDTGSGMPPPIDYRDHPEYYIEGDFPMPDRQALEASLPPHGSLLLGEVAETIPAFLEELEAPLGFVSVDLDYYSSTLRALALFDGRPDQYLPLVLVYLDDVKFLGHNPYCGELLAVETFNANHELRKITKANFLRHQRIFQRAIWIDQMFICHVLDHPGRRPQQRDKVVLANPYLSIDEDLQDT